MFPINSKQYYKIFLAIICLSTISKLELWIIQKKMSALWALENASLIRHINYE
ncbi:hypothetical protein [Alkanindiges illinoisensis]|uniref:hypothetical protein n=1 Tax=Alkanindiges illinoisensis TaxID=197183 RepID=UPI0012EC1F7A|nr:hypothetical protein [Alkanindiges illinoisensis]